MVLQRMKTSSKCMSTFKSAVETVKCRQKNKNQNKNKNKNKKQNKKKRQQLYCQRHIDLKKPAVVTTEKIPVGNESMTSLLRHTLSWRNVKNKLGGGEGGERRARSREQAEESWLG